MNLFQQKLFALRSGKQSYWKIECDALLMSDWLTIARIIADNLPGGWSRVVGVPRGGRALASCLSMYHHPVTTAPVLIVDDVLTTGASMDEMRANFPGQDVIGVVLFARGPCPDWVTPIFQLAAGWE